MVHRNVGLGMAVATLVLVLWLLSGVVLWAKALLISLLHTMEDFDQSECCTLSASLLFFIGSLLMWLPLVPLPFVFTLWCLAVGFTFKWFSLVLLTLVLISGIPLSFLCGCLLYTSDAADEEDSVDLGGRRIIKKKKNKETIRERSSEKER
eukprot:TRINITY_DN19868_c0_g2_i1.p1 TRINITY_DN19868_c0_g2~~TRINITY_DN19868_c0_g2_i1.p1  ORF type:complete len:151 (+),score=44.84 TRINITY_DN19868_c0_g2_i1:253-705(+)